MSCPESVADGCSVTSAKVAGFPRLNVGSKNMDGTVSRDGIRWVEVNRES